MVRVSNSILPRKLGPLGLLPQQNMDGEQSSFGDADEALVHRCVTIPRNDYLIPTAFPDIEVVSFIHNPQLRAHFIGTPGFDDTERSDVQALLDISHWLSGSFKDCTRLSGIIFIHRISDVRMTGSAVRNLVMFKKLCGERAFQSVALVTPMWSKVTPYKGTRHKEELV